MTISNQTNRTSATGSGSIGQTVTINFPYNATSDLKVYKRVTATGVETLLAETTNYTLTAASESGGTLTTVTAIETTEQIHIVRDTPMTQTLDLVTGGSFNAENIEDAFDKNTKLAIENSDAINRTLRFPASDPVASIAEMDNSIDRAGKYLYFDSTNGNPTVASVVDTTNVSVFMETVLDDVNSAAVQTTLGFSASVQSVLDDTSVGAMQTTLDIKGMPCFNVKAFAYGAIGDGVTDDTTAIKAAITAANTAGGGVVYFPTGTYLITSVASPIITVSSNTIFLGDGANATIIKAKNSTGNVIMFSPTNTTGVTFRHLTIDGNTSNTTCSGIRGGTTGTITNFTMENCILQNFDSDKYAFYIGSNATNVRFINNKIYNTGAGIQVDLLTGTTASHIQFSGNYCDMNGLNSAAFAITADDAFAISDVRIVGNYIYNTAGDASSGIAVNYCDGLVITGNIFKTHRIGCGFNYCKNAVVSNNIFDTCTSYAMETGHQGTKNIVITGNVAIVCLTGVIIAEPTTGFNEEIIISGNRFDDTGNTDVTSPGITARQCSKLKIQNNILINFSKPFLISGYGTDIYSLDVEVKDNYIYNNTIWAGNAISITRVDRLSVIGNKIIKTSDLTSVFSTTGEILLVGARNARIERNVIESYSRDSSYAPYARRAIYIFYDADPYDDLSYNVSIKNNHIYGYSYNTDYYAIDTYSVLSSWVEVYGNVLVDCLYPYKLNAEHKTDYATSIPVKGIWNATDQVWDSTPVSGQQMGWVCIRSLLTTVKTAGVTAEDHIHANGTLTGIASGDPIGIELDSGSWHWTTTSGTATSDSIPLTAVLPASGECAIGNRISTFKFIAMGNFA